MSRVLVLSWSHTGQVRRSVDAFVGPLTAAGHEVVQREIAPRVPYPFPWTVASFFGVFPETVLERSPDIAPIDAPGDFDLVVLAGPIWFLSPAPPLVSLVRGPGGALLRGRRTLALIVCRNMWLRGGSRLIALAREAGARVTDRIVVTHAGPAMATYFSTLFWVLTGRRDAVKVLPKAEIAEASYARVSELAAIVAARLPGEGPLLVDQQTSTLSYPHAMGEQIGWRLYVPLARIVAATSRPGGALRAASSWVMLAIVLSLILGLAIPCFTAWFLLGRRIRRWLDGLARLHP